MEEFRTMCIGFKAITWCLTQSHVESVGVEAAHFADEGPTVNYAFAEVWQLVFRLGRVA